MEINKQLKVPAVFFYNKIIDSVLYDIRKATGENIGENELENYSYIKKFSQNSSAKITIEKIKKNEEYQFITTTANNDFTVHYQIKVIDNGNCEVIYTESMVSHGALQKLNDLFLSTIMSFFKKRKFISMLNAIERSY